MGGRPWAPRSRGAALGAALGATCGKAAAFANTSITMKKNLKKDGNALENLENTE